MLTSSWGVGRGQPYLQLATSAKSATCSVLPGSPANVHASNCLVTSRAPMRCYARCYARMQVVTRWSRPCWPVQTRAVTATPRPRCFPRLAVLLRQIVCAQSAISFSLACKLFKNRGGSETTQQQINLCFLRESIAGHL